MADAKALLSNLSRQVQANDIESAKISLNQLKVGIVYCYQLLRALQMRHHFVCFFPSLHSGVENYYSHPDMRRDGIPHWKSYHLV